MKSQRFAGSLPLAPPWATWMKLWEVSTVAPMVIGYRLAGMAPAGSTPSARQRRESVRMGQEKVDAWYEATLAAGQRLVEANLALTGLVWRQLWAGAFSPVALAAPLSRLGPRLLDDSLTPVHRRVVANNRRLSRSR
jgi:hypothetical protein